MKTKFYTLVIKSLVWLMTRIGQRQKALDGIQAGFEEALLKHEPLSQRAHAFVAAHFHKHGIPFRTKG